MHAIAAFFLSIGAFLGAGYHGAPRWVWGAIPILLALDFALPKLKTKSNSTIELLAALTKLVGWALAKLVMTFPPTAFLVALIKSFFGGDPPAGGPALKTVLVLLLFGAFGCPATTAGTISYQTGYATAKTGSATLDSFEQFDHDYQLQIVKSDKAAGKSADAIAADLKAYRAKRSAVNDAFKKFDGVLFSGRGLMPLVLSGVKKQSDLNAWAAQLAEAWADIQKAITLLKPEGAK
jgi:hypothetical protein